MAYSGVILERKDKKILFQLRDNKKNISNPNCWGIFGGGINIGENPKKAAVRELKEELNLKINENELKTILIGKIFKEKYYLYYAKINKKIDELELNEGSAMEFLSRKELLAKKNVVSLVRYFIFFYPLMKKFRKLD
jgi:ADP-ribose pyrophosphatase YjhB (NUDIX family)